MTFSEKIKSIRKESGYYPDILPITKKEYFLVTTGLLSKEIIELIIATVKTFINFFKSTHRMALITKALTHPFNLSNLLTHFTYLQQQQEVKGIKSFFKDVPILEDEYVWIWIFKVVINIYIILRFVLMHEKDWWKHGILIWWLFIAINPILDLCAGTVDGEEGEGTLATILKIPKLLMLPLLVVYFIKVDKTLIDSWKLLLFENVIFVPSTNRYVKTEKSFISEEKIKKIFIWIAVAIFTIIPGDIIINLINKTIKTGQESVSQNQQKLQQAFQNNKLEVLISAVIIAPVIEEIFMRQYLISFGRSRWFTVINSSFLFALIHLSNEDIFLLLPYLMSGMVFGTIYWITRNIWNTIFAHGVFNLIAWASLLHSPTEASASQSISYLLQQNLQYLSYF